MGAALRVGDAAGRDGRDGKPCRHDLLLKSGRLHTLEVRMEHGFHERVTEATRGAERTCGACVARDAIAEQAGQSFGVVPRIAKQFGVGVESLRAG